MTTPTPTSGAADLPEALRVPLDSLHADAGYLCGRLLNGSLTQEQVVESIRRRIDAAKLAALTAQAISTEPAWAGCAITPDGEPSNVELRGMWYGAGGSFHGPNVETGTMPEAKLLPFLRSLASHGQAPARAEVLTCDESKLPGIVQNALEQLKSSVKHLETVSGHWDSRHAKRALQDLEWYCRRKLDAAAPPTPQAADTGAAQGAGITAGMEPAATVRTLGVVGVKFSGWTNYGCSLPDGTKLYTEAQVQAQIAATPQPAPPADSVLEDAAQESDYRRGYRHGYEQRDAEVRGALA